MSIFERIKNAIWKHDSTAPGAPAKTTAPPAGTAAPRQSAPTTGAAAAPAASAATVKPVDIEVVLEAKSEAAGQKLNWRTSIVDLMKLVNLDPSLANRKELAQELGYSGDMGDSAAMNIWLHKQVMQKLGESGGVVPASLRG